MARNVHVDKLVTFIVINIILHGQSLLVRAENAYGDHGIVVTGYFSMSQSIDHVITIPATPNELANYTKGETYPGFRFEGRDRMFMACDVDYSRNELYLYDFVGKEIILGTNFNSSMMKEEINWSHAHKVSQEVSRIAIDWVSHNIYWTDPPMGWIAMQPGGIVNDTSLYKVIANDDVVFPRGIAVDPLAGYLFWTDHGLPTRIERCSLTCADRKIIVAKALDFPNSITADHVTKRIFWTDVNVVGSATYDGNDRYQVVSLSRAMFWNVAVFHDTLIVADYRTFTIHFYDKTTGVQATPSLDDDDNLYAGMCMYHKDNQPVSPVGDLCSNHGCQDICVQEPGGGSGATPTCLCREGYIPDKNDPKKCKEVTGQHHRAVILNMNNKKMLCKLDIRILTDIATHTPVCFYEHPTSLNESINHIDLNMETREVYFATKNKLYSVPIDQKNTESAKELTAIVDDHTIMGLSYDWVNGHIYWTESKDGGNGSINMLDVVTGENTKLSSSTVSMPEPREITVVPHEGKMLWIAVNGTQIDINLSDLAANIGTIHTYIMSFSEPRRIIVDLKYLHVLVLEKTGIYSFTYQAQSVYFHSFEGYDEDNFVDMDIYEDYILLLVKAKDGVTSLKSSNRWSTDSGTPVQLSTDGIVSGLDDVYSMKILDKTVLQPSYKSPCRQERLVSNTVCEQVCLPAGNTSTCECETGFTVADDGFTCNPVSKPVEDNFILFTDTYYNKLYQIDLVQNSFTGIKVVDDVGMLSGVIYNYQRETITYSIREQAQIWEAAFDASYSTMIMDVGTPYYGQPEFLVLDPTNGDIYYTAVSYFNGVYDSFVGVVSKDGYDALVIPNGLIRPRGLALHPELGWMFWTDSGNVPTIERANMDGSLRKPIVIDNLVQPNGLTISYTTTASKSILYWADGSLDVIYACDMDGKNRVEIYKDPGARLMDIVYNNDYLYYTAWDKTYITKFSVQNKTASRIASPPGIGTFHTLDVYTSAYEVPKHATCANNKGGCSHFCFPNENGEYRCGCQYPYTLLKDDKTCENVPRCLASIPSGDIDETSCLRLVNETCNFNCADGFMTDVATLTCQSDQEWNVQAPCKEILCPATIPFVELADGCDVKIGSVCQDYACTAAGYEKNTDVTKLVCQRDGTWSVDSQTLCIGKCPVPNEDVDMVKLPSCKRTVNETCDVVCKEKYRYATSATNITCSRDTTGFRWYPPTRTLCEEIVCSPVIHSGVVNASSCSMRQDDNCSYVCDDLYVANDDVISITCTGTGVWSHKKDNVTLCVAKSVPPAPQTKSSDDTKVVIGVVIGVVVFIIIVVVILVFLIRSGKLRACRPKDTSARGPSVAFENPDYRGTSGTEADTTFGYATLQDDSITIQPQVSMSNVKTEVNDNINL